MSKNYHIHGGKGTKLYEVWCSMRARCNCKTNKHYKDYGGRGILVCSDWDNFSNFKKWSEENGYKEGLSIERINNDGNYEPNNCRWATMKQQCNNQRNTLRFEFNGEVKTLHEWAEFLSISAATLYQRIYVLNWSVERAFTENVSLDRYHRSVKGA